MSAFNLKCEIHFTLPPDPPMLSTAYLNHISVYVDSLGVNF